MKNAFVNLTSISPVRVIEGSGRVQPPYRFGEISIGLPLSLPGSSISADFLVGPSGEVAGVSVGISPDDLMQVKALLAGIQSERIRIREAGQLLPPRYEAYPQWNWLEVSWSETESSRLVEAQTNQVLWFTETLDDPRLTTMVLEDLDYIEHETRAWFSFNRHMPEL